MLVLYKHRGQIISLLEKEKDSKNFGNWKFPH